MRIRVHVKISGRVQGVFFRASTKQFADRLGVQGSVKNLPGGEVEAVFEGEETAVNELVNYSRHGPLRAEVIRIEVNYETYNGEYDSFKAE